MTPDQLRERERQAVICIQIFVGSLIAGALVLTFCEVLR